ncbi:MAG TPA: NHL repeat-containing protein [Candidatus Dormibacteraeota bacterium]|nr:NHL repeat-containing protein [Candidatus Dormibacteraeota bacterium]
MKASVNFALLLCAAPLVCFPQNLSMRTMAGNGTAGATNGFGSNARFSHPAGLAADGSGNIFVADTENSTVRKITTNGFASTFAGQPGATGSGDGASNVARFNGPQGVAVDDLGQVYVADSANATIRKLNSAGSASTLAGAPGTFNSFDGTNAGAQFYHPEAVAVDAGRNVYVCDTWNHTIRKITPAGVVTTLAGSAGNFGATDGTNSKARFNRPAGIAVDSATNLYVADSLNHTIRKITPTGSVSTIAGLAGVWGSADGTNSAARFYLPEALDVAPGGGVLVADSGNQLIRRISLSGTNWVVSTVLGYNGLAGKTNGTGTNALLAFPQSLAVDDAGNVYVADLGNNEVRTTRVIAPTLQVARAASQLLVSWPTSSEGFVLEQSPVLGTGAIWSPVAGGIFTSGDNFVRTNAVVGNAFYRLRFP